MAESSCQPNQSNGSSQSQRVPGQRGRPVKASPAPASASGRKIQLAQCVGQASVQNSARRNRRRDFLVEDDRIAELQNRQAEKQSERQRVKPGPGDGFFGLHCAGSFATG